MKKQESILKDLFLHQGWEHVARVRTLLSVLQTDRIKIIKISLKLLHIQLHAIFVV